jgi:hypothetical protein
VHNSLAEVSRCAGQADKFLTHLDASIKIGNSKSDTKLILQVRLNEHLARKDERNRLLLDRNLEETLDDVRKLKSKLKIERENTQNLQVQTLTKRSDPSIGKDDDIDDLGSTVKDVVDLILKVKARG